MRSSTMKHIDALFNALMCLVGLIGAKFAESFMTALSIAFQRIQGLILSDPGQAVGELKRLSKVYLEYIRNPANEDLIQQFSVDGYDTANFSDLEQVTEALKQYPVLSSIITLRKILCGEYGGSDLLYFDRIVFAILSIHRLIILPPVLDFKSITTPPRGITSNITDAELSSALANLGITPKTFKSHLKDKSANQQHIIMSSAGPNGPATWTAFSDAVALLNDLTTFTALNTYAEKTGLYRFIKDLIAVSAVPNSDPANGTPVYSGRIHTFEEWGGKTRNVAIVDYWTQLILTPLHDTIFDFLRLISTDSTFNQDGACSTIQSWTSNKDSVLYSLDLTTATDRLPAGLQARVLGYLLSDEAIGNAWMTLLNNRSYRTVDYQEIKYAVGLPMGSKSNWAMLALCHHIIVQVASMRAKDSTNGYTLSNPNSPIPSASKSLIPAGGVYSAYRLCGDDIVLNGSKTAAEYISLMTGYGLDISAAKSVHPGTTLLPAAEFCKRVFINGHEYTTIPVKLLVKTTMNGRLAPQLQSTLLMRGLELSGTGLISWLSALIDAESFSFLVILNLLPKAVTGLFGVTPLPASAPSLSTMLDDTVTINDATVAQGYTYTAAVEELKRLDALLRTTQAVQNGIEQHLLGFDQIDLTDLGWADDVKNAAWLEQFSKVKGEMGRSHPVVQAASAETTRVVNLLAQLAAGSSTISTMARLRLLDSFRNALVSSWSDPQAARAQADRSLVQKTLTSTADLIAASKRNTNSGISTTASLSFTTMISYLSRLWTVRWALDSPVTINTVRSAVLPSSTSANTRAEEWSRDLRLIKSLRSVITSKSNSSS